MPPEKRKPTPEEHKEAYRDFKILTEQLELGWHKGSCLSFQEKLKDIFSNLLEDVIPAPAPAPVEDEEDE